MNQTGSEQGVTLRDEEHPLGARITLECGARVAPCAVTCGIYGCMLHTRFFSSEDEANREYEPMKAALAALLEASNQSADGGNAVLLEACARFVETFP
jgi:hypothetical protein